MKLVYHNTYKLILTLRTQKSNQQKQNKKQMQC